MQWGDIPDDDNSYGDGAVNDNPIEQLDNLPDRLLLGLRFALAGAVLLGTDYFWRQISPSSFNTAARIFLKYFGWLGYFLSRSHYGGTKLTLSAFLALTGSLCEICGVFIFIRRAVWRFEDHRSASMVQLKLEEPTQINRPDTKRES